MLNQHLPQSWSSKIRGYWIQVSVGACCQPMPLITVIENAQKPPPHIIINIFCSKNHFCTFYNIMDCHGKYQDYIQNQISSARSFHWVGVGWATSEQIYSGFIKEVSKDETSKEDEWYWRRLIYVSNIATGETSQAIAPFHFFDNFSFHH